jgi:hypothetical protein
MQFETAFQAKNQINQSGFCFVDPQQQISKHFVEDLNNLKTLQF